MAVGASKNLPVRPLSHDINASGRKGLGRYNDHVLYRTIPYHIPDQPMQALVLSHVC